MWFIIDGEVADEQTHPREQPPKPADLLARLSSLADDTRLRLLRLLEGHELGVAELCDVLQLPQSTVSRHLKVLADGGWLNSRRNGTTNLYRMHVAEIGTDARQLWDLARQQSDGWATTRQDAIRLEGLLQSRAISSKEFFAGVAAQWTKLRAELYGQNFGTSAMLAMLPPDITVADLGCGTGQIARELATHVKRVIAVDHSPEMLSAARKLLAGVQNAQVVESELDRLAIDSEAVDAALMILSLTYVHEPAVAMTQAARIIKRGGRLIVVDLLPHDRDDFRRTVGQLRPGIARAELERWAKAAGLTPARHAPLPPEQGARGPALFLATFRK